VCYFLKVCPFPTLLRCRDEEWRSSKCKKEEKEFVSEQEEGVFWQKKLLGTTSAKSLKFNNYNIISLLNTKWWLVSQHFGLRGCQEHYTMNVEDFTLSKDDNGNEFVTFAENPTKTWQGCSRVKLRSTFQNVCNW